METILNNNNFEAEVLNSTGYYLVDFWADWCGPCKMLAPTVHEIAESNPDIKVGKVNVDDAMELAQKYQVASIPTLILSKDGAPVNQMVGFTSKENIEAMWK